MAGSKKGFIKFVVKRVVTVYIIVMVAVYLTIIIANMGGYVDEIMKSQLMLQIRMQLKGNPEYSTLPPAELEKMAQGIYEEELKRRGLDQPFFIRSFLYMKDALTLDLGRALYMTSEGGSRLVKLIILERLPYTVMLFTTAMFINFTLHLVVGLYLSRHHGSKIDKLFIALAPTSIIPGWFYGIFLILIFAAYLRVLPYGGILDVPPPTDPIARTLNILEHMVLPLSSWIIAAFFLGCYGRRTFFLIFSTEDYVEAAKAKGVPSRRLTIQYILRPTLPPIITGFALSLIGSWSGAIITETVFNWPGLGLIAYQAIGAFDTPVILGFTVIYAYLLAATVVILDILYGLVDPRIKVMYGR